MTRTTFVRVWVLDTQEMFDALGPVDSGAGGLGVGPAPTAQGFGPHEDRAGAAADVLAVLPGDPPGRSRRAGSGVVEQLQWLLVHDHDRVGPVEAAGVDAQHVLHRRHEGRVLLGRDRPARLQVRFKRPLIGTRPIVEWSIGGIPSVKATCLSNNRSVHR